MTNQVSPKSDFLNMFETLTSPDPVYGPRRVRRFPRGANQEWAEMVVCDEAPNTVRIESLLVEPERRGLGTLAMRFLCELADQSGTMLVLQPLPITRDRRSYSASPEIELPTPNADEVAKLRDWYMRFGFANHALEPKELVRQPKNWAHEAKARERGK